MIEGSGSRVLMVMENWNILQQKTFFSSSTSKHEIFDLFLFLWVIFALDPDSESGSTDLDLIRILIRNPAGGVYNSPRDDIRRADAEPWPSPWAGAGWTPCPHSPQTDCQNSSLKGERLASSSCSHLSIGKDWNWGSQVCYGTTGTWYGGGG